MAKAIRVFFNVDLRCSHEGLEAVAKKNQIDPAKLQPGEYLVFINNYQDRIKLYASNHVVAYYKSPHGRIDLRAISKIPEAFKASGKIDYDAAVKKVIEEHLIKKAKS